MDYSKLVEASPENLGDIYHSGRYSGKVKELPGGGHSFETSARFDDVKGNPHFNLESGHGTGVNYHLLVDPLLE